MRGVNKVIAVGTLGADPELKYTAGGTAICNMRMAVNEVWKDKQGEKQERTEWLRIVLFGKVAEIAGEYCKKGKPVYIEGSLRTNKYTDKDGIERYSTDIVASELQLLGGRDGAQPAERGGNARRSERSAPPPSGDLDDSEIPF